MLPLSWNSFTLLVASLTSATKDFTLMASLIGNLANSLWASTLAWARSRWYCWRATFRFRSASSLVISGLASLMEVTAGFALALSISAPSILPLASEMASRDFLAKSSFGSSFEAVPSLCCSIIAISWAIESFRSSLIVASWASAGPEWIRSLNCSMWASTRSLISVFMLACTRASARSRPEL